MDTATSTTFAALGTYVFIATAESEALAPSVDIAREILDEIDRTCSRFRDDSDLRKVNAAAGGWVEVHPTLVAAVEAALAVAVATDGLIDPLLGRAMVDLGYDRDFAALAPKARPHRGARPGAWREVRTGPTAIKIPEATALDLGSVGKAWASDVIAATISREVKAAAVVSVGGDLATAGSHRWPVEISERPDGPVAQTVCLESGGLATSSTLVRRWQTDGSTHHHVLDPITGLPVPEVWRTVSAVGDTCAGANAATTAAIVLGNRAVPWLEARNVSARLVCVEGVVHYLGRWPEPEEN